VSYQAVGKWPDELPPRISDRVLAALARKHLPASLIGEEAVSSSVSQTSCAVGRALAAISRLDRTHAESERPWAGRGD
jgi:hypothetical protein